MEKLKERKRFFLLLSSMQDESNALKKLKKEKKIRNQIKRALCQPQTDSFVTIAC